jgi:hypothetical protein
MGQDAAMYCNEESKLKQGWINDYNKEATKLWAEALGTTLPAEIDWSDPLAIGNAIGDILVGDCIVVCGTQQFVNG